MPGVQPASERPHTDESKLAEPPRTFDARGIPRAVAVEDHIAVSGEFMLSLDEFVQSQRQGARNSRQRLTGGKRSQVNDYRQFCRAHSVHQLTDRQAGNM
jgi:hypothetical protein